MLGALALNMKLFVIKVVKCKNCIILTYIQYTKITSTVLTDEKQ
jgi:hypothetical protein